MPGYFLIKSEPDKYAYAALERDGRTTWDGVRNFEARKHLRAMQSGDLALYYHSNVDKAVVGVARVVRPAYPDPSAPGEDWSAVDVAPEEAFATPIALEAMKRDRALAGLLLLTRPRLSVLPVSPAHFDHIVKLGRRPAA